MRYDEHQTFEILRNIPTELSIEEVSDMVDQFPDIPPQINVRWWRNVNTWLTFFLIGILGCIVWVFLIQETPSNPKSNTIKREKPFAIENPDKPYDTLALSGESKSTVEINAIPDILFSVDTLSANTLIDAEISDTLIFHPLNKDDATLSNRIPQVPTTKDNKTGIFTPNKMPNSHLELDGKWNAKRSGDSLCFTLRLKEKGEEWKTQWKIPFCTHIDDLSAEFHQGERQFVLEKESGELMFSRNFGGSGTFTFVPNSEFRTEMEQEVLNVEQIPLESLSFSGSHKQNWDDIPIYSNNPYALLWLKFFLTDVNTEYVTFLRQNGFQDKDLEEVWSLADHAVPFDYLKEIVPITKQLNPSLGLADIAKLYQFSVDTELLKALVEASYDTITIDELLTVNTMDISPKYIKDLHDLGFPSVDVSLLTALTLNSVSSAFIQSAINKGYVNLELKDYLILHQFKQSNNQLSDRQVFDTSMEQVDIHSYSVAPFYKLIVRGNIRIMLKSDTLNQVTFFTSQKMRERLEIKLKDGVLKISPNIGFKSAYFFDVKVSASQMKDLVAGKRAKVYSEEYFDALNTQLLSSPKAKLPNSH